MRYCVHARTLILRDGVACVTALMAIFVLRELFSWCVKNNVVLHRLQRISTRLDKLEESFLATG